MDFAFDSGRILFQTFPDKILEIHIKGSDTYEIVYSAIIMINPS